MRNHSKTILLAAAVFFGCLIAETISYAQQPVSFSELADKAARYTRNVESLRSYGEALQRIDKSTTQAAKTNRGSDQEVSLAYLSESIQLNAVKRLTEALDKYLESRSITGNESLVNLRSLCTRFCREHEKEGPMPK